MPYRSFRTQSASGFTLPVGWEPALYASNRPLPFTRSRYSAMMERAELPVQRIRTFFGAPLIA